MSALLILVSCLLATALGTAVFPTGRGTGTGFGQQTSYTVNTGGQPAVPGALYNQPQPQPQLQQATGPQFPYGGQYQLQTKLADGTVAGQYGYQTDGTNVQVTYTAGSGQAAKQQQATYTTTGADTKTTTTELLPETKTGSTATSTKTTGSSTTTTTTGITGKDKTPLTDQATETDTPSTYAIGQGQPGHTIYKLPAMGIYPNQAATFGQGNPGLYYSAGTNYAANPIPPVHNKIFTPAVPFGNQLPPPQHFTYAYPAQSPLPVSSNVYGFNSPFGFWNGRLPFPYTTTYSNFQQPAPFRQQQQHYFYGTAPGLINQFPSNQFGASPYVGSSLPGNQFPSRYYNLYYPQGNFQRYPTSINA